ncbi:hypothetical protein Patl1_30524 [Pistacia atlantica]|uniref:Uncharacterized protein n=1 Tax=Pistacia atlantica TaxID=434234 RepID=A0ACC1ACE7_9ROSI|nr:hypothetical protein Patl1_30524 [Pistacia atlantica]
MSSSLLPKHVAAVVKHQKDPLKALEMFNSVKKEDGFKHTLSTYKCMIDKLGFHGNFEEMENVLLEMRTKIDNTLLEGVYIGVMRNYGRKGKVQDAVDVFERMDFYNCEATVLSYNAIMNILVEYGYFNQVHKVYMRMRDKEIAPDVYTFTIRIKSFCRTRRPHAGLRLLKNMPSHGCEINAVAYCTVIGGFYEENYHVEAYELFDEMLRLGFFPDITTFNKLIHTLCKKGDVRESEKLLDKLKLENAIEILNIMWGHDVTPDVITYNSLLNGLCKAAKSDAVMETFKTMVEKGCAPNIITYNILIESLCKARKVTEALDLLKEIENKGLTPDLVSFGTLVNGLCNNGDLDGAYQLFRRMEQQYKISHTTATYNIMINAFSEKLNINMAEKLFNEMSDRGCCPDNYTYRVMIDGFCKTGSINSGYSFLLENIEKGFIPSLSTIGRVINCLCVDHRVHEAVAIIHLMVRKGIVPEAVNTIFEADKKEVAAPKIVVEELLKKCNITYYAYELLFDGIRDKKLGKKKAS